MLHNMLSPPGSHARLRTKDALSYYVDWKNVRLIVLDQYADFGTAMEKPSAMQWLENTITSATASDHVFIAYHEPHLPLDTAHDRFWSMLLRHRAKVRAVFTGHSHVYERRQFPDANSGIEVVDTGNAGNKKHSDQEQTIVAVKVEGKRVTLRAISAPGGTRQFRLSEEWGVAAP
jgi:hypothetical protein